MSFSNENPKLALSEGKKYLIFSLFLLFLGFLFLVGNFLSWSWLFSIYFVFFWGLVWGIIFWFDEYLGFFLLIFFLAFENFSMGEVMGISLRPYQLAGAVLFFVLILKWLLKKNKIEFLSFSRICFFCRFLKKNCQIVSQGKYFGNFDRFVFVLPFLALISGFFSPLEKKITTKGGLLILSLVVLYWIFRNFLENNEVRKRTPFFILWGSIPVLASGLWQAFFLRLKDNRFVVMPERINATFTEPDWLGIYLTIFLAFLLWLRRYFFKKKINLMVGSFWAGKIAQIILWIWLVVVFFEIFLTASRSSWLGTAIVLGIYFLFWLGDFCSKKQRKTILFKEFLVIFLAGAIAFGSVIFFDFSNFNFYNRATSSFSGKQEITVSCPKGTILPIEIESVEELSSWQCRHIRLEEIKTEESFGKEILKVYQPDPNVEIRKNIYQKSWQAFWKRPLLGWGMGSSSLILGKDERGAGLNSSNIFLEVFLSLGLIGGTIFSLILLLPLISSIKEKLKRWFFIDKNIKKCYNLRCELAILCFAGFLVPNIFNSGELLALTWFMLAFGGFLFRKKYGFEEKQEKS